MRTTSNFNSPNPTQSVDSRHRSQATKISEKLRGFFGQFWQFSLYYGEFIAARSQSPTSGQPQRTPAK
ncbi:hypothetical protein ACL6C3_29010 [Capilliphycus salinus ALCB114379]|uniref:hypothetical protein n=1 Tax=Capilliphycus salinus TaxID=2768948 RepID=UPI0039A4701D